MIHYDNINKNVSYGKKFHFYHNGVFLLGRIRTILRNFHRTLSFLLLAHLQISVWKLIWEKASVKNYKKMSFKLHILMATKKTLTMAFNYQNQTESLRKLHIQQWEWSEISIYYWHKILQGIFWTSPLGKCTVIWTYISYYK